MSTQVLRVASRRDRTIGGIWFTADLDSHDERHVSLFAC